MIRRLLVFIKPSKNLVMMPKLCFSEHKWPTFSDIQQRAAYAFFTLQFIIQIKPENIYEKNLSIRQQIIDRQIFTRYILDMVNKERNDMEKIQCLLEIGLNEENLNLVLKAFELENGFFYNSLVYNQDRIKQSMIGTQQQNQTYWEKTVLNPMIHAGQIIQGLLGKHNRVIYGDKGTGKTFTLLLYSYLSNYIIEYKMQNQSKKLEEDIIYKKLFKNGYFKSVNKMFYLPLKSIPNESQFLSFLMWQVTEKSAIDLLKNFSTQDLDPQIQLSSLLLFKRNLINKYQQGNVKIFLVVDEANSFYGLVRRFFLQQSAGTQQHGLLNNVNRSSRILKLIKFSFPQFFLNSSQAIQNRLLQAKIQNKGFFNFYDHTNKPSFNLFINYRDFAQTIAGTIELYEVFYFQLSKRLISQGFGKENFKKLRLYMQSAFGIIRGQNYQNMAPWTNNIRPLGIRTAFQVKEWQIVNSIRSEKLRINVEPLVNLLKSDKTQNSQERIQQYLIKIKKEIVQINNFYLEDELKEFLEKNTNKTDLRLRQAIIFYIRQNAYRNIKKPIQNFEVCLRDLSNIRIISKDIELQRDQHINLLLSSWDFALFDQKERILKISCSPSEFLKRSDFLLTKLVNNIQIFDLYSAIYLRRESQLTGFQYGCHLDPFVSRLFRRGNCNITFIQSTRPQKQIINKKKQYRINEGYTFTSLNRTQDFNQSFGFLFKIVQDNPSEEYICAAADTRTNEGFDFAFLRKEEEKDHYDLITLDITVSKVQDKLMKVANQRKLHSDQKREWLQQKFCQAALSNQDVNQIISFIKGKKDIDKTDQKKKLDNNFYVKFAIDLIQNEKIKNIIKIFEIQEQIETVYLEKQVQQKDGIGLQAIKLSKILKKIISKTYILRLLKQFTKQSSLKELKIKHSKINKQAVKQQISKVQVTQNGQYCQIVEQINKIKPFLEFNEMIKTILFQAILIFKLQYSNFKTKDSLIEFIRQIHSFSKDKFQARYNKSIPDCIKDYQGLKKHHFFTPFQYLRRHNQRYNLKWTHIILVPQYRAEQYLNQFKDNEKKQNKNEKEYLFRKYFYNQGNRVQQLSFALASFNFEGENIQIHTNNIISDQVNDQLLKLQLEFIRKISALMDIKKAKNNKKK